MNDCLLIKTSDEKKFLVNKKNMKFITEYVKTFNAELYLVEVIQGKVISQLKNLASAICNPEYKNESSFKIIEKIYPKSRNTNNSSKIKKHILEKFQTKQIVSLKDLKNKYKKQEITDACLSNYFSSVRKQLLKNGNKIKKIGQGNYILSDEE